MKVSPYETESFGFDGRGPELKRYIHDFDRIAADTFTDRALPPGEVTGAEYCWSERSGSHWVIFEGLQVIQTVPEEVCSYWFLDHLPPGCRHLGILEIGDSEWRASFNQRHSAKCTHFILLFYDEILEIICERLVFGVGEFHVSQHPELSDYKDSTTERTRECRRSTEVDS
jgi:hypothetical protein